MTENLTDSDKKQLVVGIDMGTSKTAIITDTGFKGMIRSVVGYPKDIIGVKLLGKTQVFGEEALKNHSALRLYYPLEDGVIKDSGDKDYNAAYELLKYMVDKAKQGQDIDVCGVIGVPSRASHVSKELISSLANEFMKTSMVVSQAFMVAYELNKLNNCIIIDIGAGTIDICGIRGTVPQPDDQVSIPKGGDYIDDRLETAIVQQYPAVQVTPRYVRGIKEAHSFVGNIKEPIMVTLRSEGKPSTYDLTEIIKSICESIIPDIIEQMISVIMGFDPDDQEEALKNIYLTGGGSRIRGIDKEIQRLLTDYGEVKVTRVNDPEYIGCAGALRMARDMPPEYWDKVSILGKYSAALHRKAIRLPSIPKYS